MIVLSSVHESTIIGNRKHYHFYVYKDTIEGKCKENGLKLFEIILSSLHLSPVNGMLGAMVVACQAIGA